MSDIEIIVDSTNVEVITAPGVTSVEVSESGTFVVVETAGIQGTQGIQGLQGDQGDQGITGDAGPATPVDYQGTGSPESVQTAIVGKTYRDNAGTNGAWLWIKVTGTGNTGWKVVHGDTGWRDLGALLTNGWTAAQAPRLRRDGRSVIMHVGNLSGSAATADGVISLPLGFRYAGAISPRFFVMTGSAVDATRAAVVDISQNNVRITGATYTALSGGHLYLQWYTTDSWPTSLPGSPVA